MGHQSKQLLSSRLTLLTKISCPEFVHTWDWIQMQHNLAGGVLTTQKEMVLYNLQPQMTSPKPLQDLQCSKQMGERTLWLWGYVT